MNPIIPPANGHWGEAAADIIQACKMGLLSPHYVLEVALDWLGPEVLTMARIHGFLPENWDNT